MIFQRSQPRQYKDYTLYRQLLRRDFRYRCAYCLTHEHYLGGEAGCCIEHYRPVKGKYARPDFAALYTNLYWCCRECNENKGDDWTSPEEEAQGKRYLDPCRPEDDHDLHYRILPNGALEPLTPAGEYTIARLKLWRPQLQHHRAMIAAYQEEETSLLIALSTKVLTTEQRELLESRLAEIRFWLKPPVFDRPRGNRE